MCTLIYKHPHSPTQRIAKWIQGGCQRVGLTLITNPLECSDSESWPKGFGSQKHLVFYRWSINPFCPLTCNLEGPVYARSKPHFTTKLAVGELQTNFGRAAQPNFLHFHADFRKIWSNITLVPSPLQLWGWRQCVGSDLKHFPVFVSLVFHWKVKI